MSNEMDSGEAVKEAKPALHGGYEEWLGICGGYIYSGDRPGNGRGCGGIKAIDVHDSH